MITWGCILGEAIALTIALKGLTTMTKRFNIYAADAAQQALGFVNAQTTYIERQVYETVYPDIQYPALVPIDTSAPEWIKSVTYMSTDKAGQAGWFHAAAKDLHFADVNRQKNETTVEMADIGYEYNLEEIGQALLLGIPLTSERAQAAVRAYEEFVDDAALRGKPEKNFNGLIDYPGIPTTLASIETGHTVWNLKSADGMLADVNAALSGMYVSTLQVELADTLLLPLEALIIMSTKRIPDTEVTVLDFIMRKNVYTLQTGAPLMIRGVRGLETAGENGSGRMIAYRRDPQVLKMHIPMPHRFMPVFQTGPLVFAIPGIFRLGGLEVRRPQAVRYVDGILTVDVLS